MLTLSFLTLTVAVAVSGTLSGIEMGPFDLFSASATGGNLDGALHQGYDQLALVICGPAHVGLGIGGSTGRFCGGGHGLVIQTFSPERRLRLGRADRC